MTFKSKCIYFAIINLLINCNITIERKKKMTDAQKLKNYLDSVPKKKYSGTKSLLVTSCKVEEYVFNNWLYGKCRIPALAKDKIEEIVGEEIFKNNNQ